MSYQVLNFNETPASNDKVECKACNVMINKRSLWSHNKSNRHIAKAQIKQIPVPIDELQKVETKDEIDTLMKQPPPEPTVSVEIFNKYTSEVNKQLNEIKNLMKPTISVEEFQKNNNQINEELRQLKEHMDKPEATKYIPTIYDTWK